LTRSRDPGAYRGPTSDASARPVRLGGRSTVTVEPRPPENHSPTLKVDTRELWPIASPTTGHSDRSTAAVGDVTHTQTSTVQTIPAKISAAGVNDASSTARTATAKAILVRSPGSCGRMWTRYRLTRITAMGTVSDNAAVSPDTSAWCV